MRHFDVEIEEILEYLPQNAQRLIAVCGVPLAVEIIQRFGGLSVSRAMADFVAVIGEKRLTSLNLGRGRFYVPRCDGVLSLLTDKEQAKIEQLAQQALHFTLGNKTPTTNAQQVIGIIGEQGLFALNQYFGKKRINLSPKSADFIRVVFLLGKSNAHKLADYAQYNQQFIIPTITPNTPHCRPIVQNSVIPEHIQPLLNARLQRIADIVGFDGLAALICHFGGQAVRFSHKAKNNPLSLFTPEQAQRLTTNIKGAIYIPQQIPQPPTPTKSCHSSAFSAELLPYLPEIAVEIADLVGLDGLAALVNQYGGEGVKISRNSSRYAQLIALLGKSKADRLADHFGGEVFYLPKCTGAIALQQARQLRQAVNADYERLYKQFLTSDALVNELARHHRCSDRQILEILNNPAD